MYKRARGKIRFPAEDREGVRRDIIASNMNVEIVMASLMVEKSEWDDQWMMHGSREDSAE